MKLKSGLNILVGPNGSGKTNIISFFEFLSYLQENEIHEAVSLAGGAGSIFTKMGDTQFGDSIQAEIFGGRLYDSKRFVKYRYSFEISVNNKAGQIYFRNQRISLEIVQKPVAVNKRSSSNIEWDLDILIDCNNAKDREVVINKFDRRKIRSRYGGNLTKDELNEDLEFSVFRYQNRSIMYFLSREFDIIRPLASDMIGGEVLNIIPSKIKQPEDIAKEPGIKKDGTGLAATLFAIKNKRFKHTLMAKWYHQQIPINPKVYNQIIALTKLANASITDITVTNNPFDNQLIIKISISSVSSQDIMLPLSAMSDGTIKWITLLTAILSSNKTFSIEEPENFLHPWMQSEIIKIMRNTFGQKKHENFILMSTHSETLLNNADPEEIIVISMERGQTKAKRVVNQELLRQEISNTGFGLGFYYLSGSLNNE